MHVPNDLDSEMQAYDIKAQRIMKQRIDGKENVAAEERGPRRSEYRDRVKKRGLASGAEYEEKWGGNVDGGIEDTPSDGSMCFGGWGAPGEHRNQGYEAGR